MLSVSQVIYGALGRNASFDFIEEISPCIDLFRHVIQTVESEFAIPRRSGKHSAPDIQNDIKALVDKLASAKVHEFTPGRTSRMKDVVDVFATGVSKVFGVDKKGGKLADFEARLRSTSADTAEAIPEEEVSDPGLASLMKGSSSEEIIALVQELLADFADCEAEDDNDPEEDYLLAHS